MNIAFLGSSTSWYLQDLRRAAGDRHTLVPLAFHQLQSTVTDSGLTVRSGEYSLSQFDCVLVRTMPPGSLEQVVLRMDILGQWSLAGNSVFNHPKSLEAAIDKYLTLAKLRAAGIRVPDTICCQTRDDAMEAFHRLGQDVVLKPIFGGEGRGLVRLQDEGLAHRAFAMLDQMQAVLYVQRFIRHPGRDLRLLVIGDRVLGMQRENPHDWRTNVSLGGKGTPLAVTAELAQLAIAAAHSVGADMAGVDLLRDEEGQLICIEVNAVPGWQATSRVLDVDVAQMVLNWMESRVASCLVA